MSGKGLSLRSCIKRRRRMKTTESKEDQKLLTTGRAAQTLLDCGKETCCLEAEPEGVPANCPALQGKSCPFLDRFDLRYQHAEAALQLTTSRFERLLNASPVALYALKIEGGRITPTWVSANIAQMTGYTAMEARSYEWWA